ncbi:MAG TPA: serine hydrolase [Thermoanaerobaculia bacterium]|jgi:CubicO group peptidase (beta-lactamase class C family)|nr:serine hydrolase [Thermoanaerobaculia bacterium]
MSQRLAVTVLFTLGVLSVVAPASAVNPESETLSARLEREVPELMRAGDIPGMSIVVIQDGKIYWSGALGVRDVATGALVQKDTVFSAASLSKPVVAYVALRLADRGLIDLDTPLFTYLPYDRLREEKRAGLITARMVLSHSTGLPNWGPEKLSLVSAPGERFGYSGEGFLYLQRVLEKLTGMPLQDLARKEVFEPLGMKRSSFVWESSFSTGGGAVVGVDEVGQAQTIPMDRPANAASSLLTTAEDYARFLIAVLINGQGLKKATADAMLTPQIRVSGQIFDPKSPPGTGEVAWGLGCGLERSDSKEPFWFWHWGDNGGFRNWMTVSREKRSGVVYFTNTFEGLSIAEAVSSLAVGASQPAFGRLQYERYDSPRRLARIDIERIFSKQGGETGLQHFRELQAKSPDVVDAKLGKDLASFLNNTGKSEAAHAVAKLSLEAHPNSIEAQENFGEAALRAGEFEVARASFAKVVTLQPDDPEIKREIQWVDEVLAAQKSPPPLSTESLRRFAGNYGARHIKLDGSALFYQREGRPSYKLLPLSGDTFFLEGLGFFRLRFVTNGEGHVTKLIGLYSDGSEDESPRTAG